MQDLQRRLLMGEEGQRIHMLRLCCTSEEGRQWCRQRFTVYDVLDWMWKEGQGDQHLLEVWPQEPDQAALLQALLPEGFQSTRLAQLLFLDSRQLLMD